MADINEAFGSINHSTCTNEKHKHRTNQQYCSIGSKCPECKKSSFQVISYDGGSTLKCNICGTTFKAKKVSNKQKLIYQNHYMPY
jgi:hypothetical protein